jgi:L-amino acid N-acyltransferase YncA
MITIQEEEYPAFVQEARPLFPAHWAELALDKDEVPLDPNYDEYLQRYQAGQCLIVTAREDGTLAGYSVNFVAPGLHYRTCLTLTTDIYWVRPDARGARMGLEMFDRVHELAYARGVKRIFAGVKEHFSAAWMFERMEWRGRKYRKVESYYALWMGE